MLKIIRTSSNVQIPSDKTTDALLSAYKAGTATEAERRYLEVMLFQYGRYLTIESSRETPEDDPYRETLPSNLQGIWVGANNSAWHADYHMNVNLHELLADLCHQYGRMCRATDQLH